jgi:hypothetical protein
MKRNRKNVLIFSAFALFALTMSGCERKSINQILADPSRYSNREVTVAGEVVKSVSVMGRGAYELDDGTGKLWIVSEKGVPREGARVLVTGTIRDAYNLGAIVQLPKPISSGLVMLERSHRARQNH